MAFTLHTEKKTIKDGRSRTATTATTQRTRGDDLRDAAREFVRMLFACIVCDAAVYESG